MKRFRFVLLAVVALVVGVLTTASFASPLRHHARARTGLTIRWDIISFNGNFANPINPGGSASAHAPDGTKITLTGSGTFGGLAKKVTGGGNWTTYDASGAQSGTGTYKVVSLVNFIEANLQSQTPVAIDKIGDVNKRANGTAVLRIAFSGGSQGVLTIGCHGPGAPPGIFEGIATSKGFKLYYEAEDPKPAVDANRTIFHVGV
jgi:hypothetical protein